MIIVDQRNSCCVDVDSIESFFISLDNSIKVNFKSGRGCQIGKYHTKKEAQEAFDYITIGISRDIKLIRLELVEKQINIISMDKGKKIKSHGGS